jgi:hypothetical protein
MRSAQAARQALAKAFPPAPLDTHDWAYTYDSRERFRAETNGKAWPEIPVSVAEWHHDVVHSLGPRHFAQIVPAFLNAVLGQEGLDALPRFLCSSLTPRGADDELFQQRIAVLTTDQRTAVANALATVRDLREQTGGTRYEFLDSALDAFWNQYVTGEP